MCSGERTRHVSSLHYAAAACIAMVRRRDNPNPARAVSDLSPCILTRDAGAKRLRWAGPYDHGTDQSAALVMRAEVAVSTGRVEGHGVDLACWNVAGIEGRSASRQHGILSLLRQIRIVGNGVSNGRRITPLHCLV